MSGLHAVVVPHVSEATSHVVRGTAITDALKRSGWTTTFIVSEKGSRWLAAHGHGNVAGVLPWDWGHNQYDSKRPWLQDAAYVDTVCALQVALREMRPDVVVGIPGIASFQAACSLGIPHLSVLHGPWLLPAIEHSGASALAGERQAFAVMARVLDRAVTHQLEVQADALGSEPLSYLDYFESSEIAIVHPGSCTTGSTNRHVCGFVKGSFGGTLPSGILSVPRHSVCCVSFGSAVSADISNIVDCVARVFKEVLVVAGVSTLTNPASNVISMKSLRPESLVGRIGLLVSHGGIGTIAAGVEAGVANLAIPTDIDQAINASLAHRASIASVLGLEAWVTRQTLGRVMPQLDQGQLIDALEQLRTAAACAATPSTKGAADVAMIASRLIRR